MPEKSHQAIDEVERAIRAGRVLTGMSFQQKVWALLCQIPAGSVATYGDLAKAVGCKSARAVGMALHRNPYAPQVPCHRVVGSTGRLTGYALGLDAKRALLEQEGVSVQGDRVSLQRRHRFDY